MKKNIKMVMGGKLYRQFIETDRRKTAGDEIEIAQYKKSANGEWELIKLDPKKCLEEKTYS